MPPHSPGNVGALTLVQIRKRAQQAKQVRMEKLKAELLEEKRRVDRENHIQSVRMIALRPLRFNINY